MWVCLKQGLIWVLEYWVLVCLGACVCVQRVQAPLFEVKYVLMDLEIGLYV